MKTRWSKLFRSSARNTRRATRPVRKLRLAVEALDERVLPSANAVLSNGILTITADNNGSNADFSQSGSQALVIYDGGQSGQAFSGPINQVVFQGGSGKDIFTNSTNIPDLVIGSSGNDTYNGGSGLNLLNRNGNDVSWNTTTGQNVVFGLAGGNPTASELSATGAMMVSLSSDQTQLTIAGPSGIGFQLNIVSGGKWIDTPVTSNGQTTHSFTPSLTSGGSVVLHTGGILGDIPLLGAGLAGLTITTQAEPWTAPVGAFNQLTAGPGGFLPINTNASGTFSALASQYGVDLQLPSSSWGLQLGSNLTASSGALSGAPLNNAVPYFYVAVNQSAQANIGGLSVSTGRNVQVAFDPSDPFLYGSVGDYAIGASVNGRIAYTPAVAFNGPVFGASVPNPDISGNVYVRGSISLGDVPLTIKGEAVIGLFKNGSGVLSGISASTGDALLNASTSLLSLTNSMAAKPEIGLNGELDVGVDVGGGAVSLAMKVGEASAFFDPNYVNPDPGLSNADIAVFKKLNSTGLFHLIIPNQPTWANGPVFAIVAQSSNPWAGVPIVGNTMSQVMPNGNFTLDGMVDSQKNWGVQVNAASATLFGLTPASVEIDASSTLNTIHFQAAIHPGFGLFSTAQGDLNLSNGQFTLTDTTGFSFGITAPLAGQFTATGSETLTVSYSGGSNGQISAGLKINASAALPFGSASLSVSANVAIGPSYAITSGSGQLEVYGVDVAGVQINNTDVSITVAGKTSTFNWPSGVPGDLEPDGPGLVGAPVTLNFFVPQGITDPVHFSAALSPDDLAADYDSTSTNSDFSFTFAAAGTYSVYGRMYLADGTTSDYTTTVTVYGSDQDNAYFVQRLYHDLLGRTADGGGLAYFTGALASGASRGQVAQMLLQSTEYLQDLVQSDYHEMLNRYADPAGLQSWVSFLQAGNSADALRLQIAESPEYSQLHADDLTFVEGLYQDALGRMGTTDETDYYNQVLAGGASREEVVQAFFASSEHQTNVVEQVFQTFLRRDADPSGLFFYSQALAQGQSDFDLMASVLAGAEYAPQS